MFTVSTLLNDLIWKTYNVNVFNINVEYKIILLIIILLLTKNHSNNNFYLIITCSILTLLTANTMFLYFMFYRLIFNNSFSVVHHILILSFLQYMTIEQNFSRWYSSSYGLFNYIFYNNSIDTSTYLKCTTQINWPFISESFMFLSKNGLYDTSNNFIYGSTSLEFKTFSIKSTLSVSVQDLISDSTPWVFINSIVSTETLVLSLTLYILYTLIIYGIFNKIKVRI